ncbi:MAG: RluA family pseudouridine synthase [Caldilineaceae bacterium]|nr:RluA family pseudouridine synthase [Caldilineaceae bacterium]
MQIHVRGLAQPARLDRLLRDRFPQWGRQAVQQLISAKQVRINAKVVWLASWKVNNGDHIELLSMPAAKPIPPAHFDEQWLLAAEDDLIVINKPSGLLAEAPGLRDAANLRDLAIARFGDLILFHRLDRDTSGVVLLTRPGPINHYLDHAFKEGLIRKSYLAVVATPNRLQAEGTIAVRLDQHPRRRDMMTAVNRGGKHAVTDYRVLAEEPTSGKQLVALYPQTGRTHQLRVHLAHIGAPILGDRLYGEATSADRLLLHAHQIELPASDSYPARRYCAPLPAEFGEWGIEIGD